LIHCSIKKIAKAYVVSVVKRLRLLILACAVPALSGCISVGGEAVRMHRIDYNEAIHDTNVEQLLLNIVRVHDAEIPLFVDLVELDSSNTVTAGVTGGGSNIGGRAGNTGGSLFGTIGAITGTASVSDTPIAKYVPLSGYPLIQQVSLPIGLSAISKLTTSGWPDATLLYFSFQRLTPAYLDFYRALDTLLALDSFGAITLQSVSDDELTINFQPTGNLSVPEENWRAAVESGKALPCVPHNSEATVRTLWAKLKGIYGGGAGNKIVLGTPKDKAKHVDVSARSGLGALKEAETSAILFTTRDVADAIRAANAEDTCNIGEFYYNPSEATPLADYPARVHELWTQHFDAVYEHNEATESSRELFRYLGHHRVYMIVEVSAERPVDAYSSVFKDGKWYSIAASDRVSKQNFAVLSQLLTIQAIPAPEKSTLPTTLSIPTR
jgi:hypothetical protein